MNQVVEKDTEDKLDVAEEVSIEQIESREEMSICICQTQF